MLRDGMLHIADHSISDLAKDYGTPLYIFDRATIVSACERYKRAFTDVYTMSDVRMLYASKAYISPLLARLVVEQGMGLDVVSAGELLVAQHAHVPVERVSFHGNNKMEEELRLALTLGVGRVVLDNWSELERLTHLAHEMHLRPRVLLRVAPNVETETHRYLQTGHAAAKFGFPLAGGEAKAAIVRLLRENVLDIVGLHAHSGTMLYDTRPYCECLTHLLELADTVYSETRWWPHELSPGGGWGVETVETLDTKLPSIETLAQALQQTMRNVLATLHDGVRHAPTLLIEPGRSIIARAGVAIYRVGARKETPGGVTYLFVDGGMADNIRPALYHARYTALPVQEVTRAARESVCIAGRYCESGDTLVESVTLPHMREGELLAVPTSGAYCLPMASNYNLVPRPAALLVSEQQVLLMERRETYQDLLARYA
jgi:diaminopimelate decarboxylase